VWHERNEVQHETRDQEHNNC